MSRPWLWIAACLLVLPVPSPARSAEPELVSVKKIWDQGKHNAFTDLIRWHDTWYCTFRESDAHVGGDGGLRLLESADGETWKSAAYITEKGVDLRDPKLSITPDGRLMIVAGGSLYEGTKTLKGRQPRVMFSTDGHKWTDPKPVLTDGEWLWRVTWHGGTAYGVSYGATPPKGKDDKSQPNWTLKLFSSTDGVKYDLVKTFDIPGRPNETTLRFLPDGEMIALVRREADSKLAWIGRSKAPYKDWTWTETKHQVGGPNFIQLPDGALWAVGRSYPGGAKTVVARMTLDSYEPVLTLPSGGDTSYAGLAWHDGLLWISYYSSHEGKTSIYLAKVKVPLKAEKIGQRVEPFVDDYLIDRLVGKAGLEVQKPTPKELVFTADKPWEGNTSAYFTIFQDGDTYRMYYRGSHFDEQTKKASHREVTCYAESKDGIHWVKPNLGLFEFDSSKENNIVWNGPGTHNFTPFKDANPAATAEAKYKALALGKGGLLALQSPDAIHWTRLADAPVITKGAFDSQNLAFWDGYAKTYREYHRAFRKVRDIMTGTSPDFLNWTAPVFLDYTGAPLEHLYTNAIMRYARAPHLLVGFPTRFHPTTQQVEPTFMSSRDGQTFHRFEDPVIPFDAPEDRDGNRSNYMAWGLLTLPGHDQELSVYGTEAYYKGPASRLRRFSYRLDGFAALHAGSEGGEAITRPVEFEGKRLVLNSRTADQGQIQVELQDADGKPIDGFTAKDSPDLSGDEINAAVSWTKGGDLSSLAGKPIRIRFILKDADLFSFRFE
ncbi:MAG: sialidase family protein [Isosphaeraceae bacterium]